MTISIIAYAAIALGLVVIMSLKGSISQLQYCLKDQGDDISFLEKNMSILLEAHNNRDTNSHGQNKIAVLQIDMASIKSDVERLIDDMDYYKKMIEERHEKLGELMRMVSAQLEKHEETLKRLENK